MSHPVTPTPTRPALPERLSSVPPLQRKAFRAMVRVAHDLEIAHERHCTDGRNSVLCSCLLARALRDTYQAMVALTDTDKAALAADEKEL
jgi:hypothetical protein